ncbi:uncharacterized protein LOC134817028 [Bolinopsis microptera]|uniref:uncharacterized protein LOC134817028 n=1 Tax=Bolinopsis microptera TaxID=2820187 RepID=UPI00307AAAF8
MAADGYEGDVKYGGLFKQSGFFKPNNNKSWGKRFFLFNTRTMLLQYWPGEEERIFKVEQAVSGPPRSSISLLTSNLVVESLPVERSMFGQKFPIKISAGPAFSGRVLVLAASSFVARETWIKAIQNSIENLKERQRVKVIQTKIVKDPNQAGYNSLENQYMMVKEKESQVKELEQKISRTIVQCDMLRGRDKKLYAMQERLMIAHRDIEDKLYSMTQEENNPKRRFKFINVSVAQTMFEELPIGIYRHTAVDWINVKTGKKGNKLNIPNDDMRKKILQPGEKPYSEVQIRLSNRAVLEEDREHPAWRLEDKQYHPYVTYNTVADGIDKQYDDSPKTFINDATGEHQIRIINNGEDYDAKSLKEMNVFDFLKSDKFRPGFHLDLRRDKADGEDLPDDEVLKTNEEQVEFLDKASRHQDRPLGMNEAVRDYTRGRNSTPFDSVWEERYQVDNSGHRF